MGTAVVPLKQQLLWAECEVGVIIHLDVQVFEPTYTDFRKRWGYTPLPGVFNPPSLNTDQWLETAKMAGAKYAVLVAKHCSGFSLWPTDAHEYSVKNSPWKDGKGDVVADFIASCHKYNILPGIYCSAACNAYCNVDNPGRVRNGTPKEQKRYNAIVEKQLKELWGNYGELFEIWFDGGVIPPNEGGPDLIPLLYKYQPNAVVFQGPKEWPSLLRHIGNERAVTPEPFWNTTNVKTCSDGIAEFENAGGSPDACFWVPGESDIPNRRAEKAFQGGWFWRAGEDAHLFTHTELVERYFTSVGRNTNLLLGMVIDNQGLVPDADRKRFAEFGATLNTLYASRVASTEGEGNSFILDLPLKEKPSVLSLMEELRYGERVRKFVVEGRRVNEWVPLWRGINIGHRHLERFRPLDYSQLRLRILESAGTPMLRDFSAWNVGPDNLICRLDPAERAHVSINRDLDGSVCLTCDNPYLQISYTTDGTDPVESSAVFAQPFAFPNGGMIKATAFCNGTCSSPIFRMVFGVCRKGWEIVRVSLDSPFTNGGMAGVRHLLSDDIQTYWHTFHTDKTLSAPPHEVVLRMERKRRIEAFTLLAHNFDGYAAPEEYELEISMDGEDWTTAALGKFSVWTDTGGMQVLPLSQPVAAKYLRLRCTRVVDGLDYLMLAGLGVIET